MSSEGWPGGGTPFNLPNITWLVVWGPGQWARMPTGDSAGDVNDDFIGRKTHQQGLLIMLVEKETSRLCAKLCRDIKDIKVLQVWVESDLKWISWSFTVFCLYLISLTHCTDTPFTPDKKKHSHHHHLAFFCSVNGHKRHLFQGQMTQL